MEKRFDLLRLRIIEKEHEGILFERGGANSSAETIYVYKKTERGVVSVGQIKSDKGALSDYEFRTKLATLLHGTTQVIIQQYEPDIPHGC